MAAHRPLGTQNHPAGLAMTRVGRSADQSGQHTVYGSRERMDRPAAYPLHVVLAVIDEFAMDVLGRSIHRMAPDGGTGVTPCTAPTGGSRRP
jgi:hypothetical protein